MSRDPSYHHLSNHGNYTRNTQYEANENEFDHPMNFMHFPPPRTPLSSIPDPSQYQREFHELNFDSRDTSEGHGSVQLPDVKGLGSDDTVLLNKGSGIMSQYYGTPKVSNRGKAHSEPNSAQSTSLRSASKASNIGAMGAWTGSKQSQNTGGRGGSSSRVCRGISYASLEPNAEVPHFEVVENPSFWKDHNVQVLIRIRPLSTMETVSQGYGRCLRQESAQTLVWLGHPETRFTFDHIASEMISQEKLFRVAGLPMVENCMSGYNSCMFAYGQTGSGKTYTMMGEIYEMEGELNKDRGITPRIFEYLFMRIRADEETRRGEKLKYSCKCSFLEIYNEQITDLLEPLSTNLQLREDIKKGVYVENLKEYNVMTVNDVVKLLLQGAANRKMAATHMNSESSRSHSVLTCTIESCWEKDSRTHFRFGRLNLVDLAGSERQKSSGAEGDRLKEAANINKSLSTLGLVIMSLVDLAHGKHRHVPYRDSRLTFLLQDSLGGNSKTTIIANVSPSICSANETLSTLKFAQRAKLIQNNAKVNEDATEDVMALQRQIQELKGQLSTLMKHHNVSRSLSPANTNFYEEHGFSGEGKKANNNIVTVADNKMKRLEGALRSALRREKVAESAVERLKAEIEHMSRLAHQMEEDSQRAKMMLRFREEKIKRLEFLADGIVPMDKYLTEENKALVEEIHLLKERIDKNPELAKFAMENARLLEQFRVFQEFYVRGERETLFHEVSELRDQLLEMLQGNSGNLQIPSRARNQQVDTLKDLEDCRNMNAKLAREVEELRNELRRYSIHDKSSSDSVADCMSAGLTLKESKLRDKYSLVELKPVRSDSEDETASYKLAESDLDDVIDYQKELMAARLLIKAMENKQIRLIEELHVTREEKQRCVEILKNKDVEERKPLPKLECDFFEAGDLEVPNKDLMMVDGEDMARTAWQANLERMSKELEKAKLLNIHYQEGQHEVEIVREQVEIETARTILHLQDEVAVLQLQFNERFQSMVEENTLLRNSVSAKEHEIKVLCAEWERATLELTGFLTEGSRSLEDASLQIESIASSFPQVNVRIGEHIERAAKFCVEKDEMMLNLQERLEMAQKAVLEMDHKLCFLRGAAMALSEAQQLENNEVILSSTLLNEKINMMEVPENKVNRKEDQHMESDKLTSASRNGSPVENTEFHMEFAKGMQEFEEAVNASYSDVELFLEYLEIGINEVSSIYQRFVQDFLEDVDVMRKNFLELKEGHNTFLSMQESKFSKLNNNTDHVMHQIRHELAKTNEGLHAIEACLRKLNLLGKSKGTAESDGWSSSSPMSDSDDQEFPCENQELEDLMKPMKHSIQHEELLFSLRKELETAFKALNKLHHWLATDLNEKKIGNFSYTEYIGSSSAETSLDADRQCISKRELNHLAVQMTSSKARVLLADENINHASSFIAKFEEARLTMKEADVMLNALLKANDNANELTAMWKQAGEALMVEKASLTEEVEQLKLSTGLKERESERLQEQIQYSLIEIANSISLLEGSFFQMQKDVEDWFKVLYGDVFSIGKDILNFIINSRLSLEDTSSEIVEKGFTLILVLHSLIENFLHKFPNVNHHKEGLMEEGELTRSHDDPIYDNLSLKYELERKEILLSGLLFDFRLLQESASNTKDIKDETEKLISSLRQVRHELEMKTSELDRLSAQNQKLEGCLADTETALINSNFNIKEANQRTEFLTEQNAELRMLLKDLYLKKSEAEDQLYQQKEVVKGLENEIIRISSLDKRAGFSVKDIEEDLRRITQERDCFLEEIGALSDKLELAYALADEKEAIALEARQESEASKLYAEQKEDEVQILERSIEELESTVNVLERKVFEMREEVEGHRLIRDTLELELLALRERMLTVENFSDNMDSANSNCEQEAEDQISKQMKNRLQELHEAHKQIRVLKEEREEQAKEIKQCREYISELILHGEAQASQYQQKYKTLEAMVCEVNTDSSTSKSLTAPTLDITEKSSTRTRGSSSPFKCIASLVQQMKLEKDQELSVARTRIEELEALVGSRQKEVCMLSTRLAAAESMTHDVIRDLLGVKLDMTNYADLIEQYQAQKLVEAAQQKMEDSITKEQEIINLKEHIKDLIEERESCILDIKKREADVLAAQMTVEQLRERDCFLTAQNEMLKVNKANLKRKVAELDEMVKILISTQDYPARTQQPIKIKEDSFEGLDDAELTKRLSHSQRLLSLVNDEISQYRKHEFSSRHQKR